MSLISISDRLLTEYEKRKKDYLPFIVGIDGLGGAGKTSIVVIEGVFIQRVEWRAYFDFVIFIDCPHNERKERVLNWDLYIGNYESRLNKYEKRYWIAEENYIKMEDPLKKADMIYSSMSEQ